jgi:hypothetical protein
MSVTSSPISYKNQAQAYVTYIQFLQRGRVLSLWRQVLRSTRRIADENTRQEMRQLAREEFERNKAVTDLVGLTI